MRGLSSPVLRGALLVLVSAACVAVDTILAKHDERYMPPQLGDQKAEHKAGKTLSQ